MMVAEASACSGAPYASCLVKSVTFAWSFTLAMLQVTKKFVHMLCHALVSLCHLR